MTEPKITEEQLDRLLKCLVREFKRQHGQTTHKLSEKVFYLTTRMGCSKEAGLNYECRESTGERDVYMVRSSVYVTAVKELAHRGFVEFTGNKITFVLTGQGYDAGRSEPIEVSIPSRIKHWANENPGPIALVGIVVAIVLALI